MNEDHELPLIRACASCEKEIGPMKAAPGQSKSHSYCRRHSLAAFGELGPAMIRKIQSMPDDAFPPDLAEHPELVDFENKEQFDKDQDIGRRDIKAREIARRAGVESASSMKKLSTLLTESSSKDVEKPVIIKQRPVDYMVCPHCNEEIHEKSLHGLNETRHTCGGLVQLPPPSPEELAYFEKHWGVSLSQVLRDHGKA